jgi:UDP-glucose 4-epimerase
MRIVVTGGAGYIGSVVTELLLANGHSALVIDDLSKGHRHAIAPEADFLQLNLLDGPAVTEALRMFQPEVVVHLAASSIVGESMAKPDIYYRNNVVAGLALLDAMRAADVNRLVFSSTAAVYGEPDRQPVDEDAPLRPTNTYGETKLAFERALRWYASAYGLSSVSLRYFNAAGATTRNCERHSPETHLIPLVLDAAAGRAGDVTVFGDDYPTRDGTCVRDYIHVLDLAHAHLLAIDRLRDRGICRAYNLGCGGDGYTVREVITTAERVTGRTVVHRIVPRRQGDPAVLVASSARIGSDLGWKPRLQDLEVIVQSAWNCMHTAPPGRVNQSIGCVDAVGGAK